MSAEMHFDRDPKRIQSSRTLAALLEIAISSVPLSESFSAGNVIWKSPRRKFNSHVIF